jgi:hypothetical protein
MNYLYNLCSPPFIQKTKIPRALSQATASDRHNVFTFTRPLSEGRAGEAWEPSDKMMLSPANHSLLPPTPISLSNHSCVPMPPSQRLNQNSDRGQQSPRSSPEHSTAHRLALFHFPTLYQKDKRAVTRTVQNPDIFRFLPLRSNVSLQPLRFLLPPSLTPLAYIYSRV